MNKFSAEALQQAKIVLIYCSKESDSSLIQYYNLCKAIFGNAMPENKPEILLDKFNEAINSLPYKEQQALRLRYGIHTTPHTYAYVAEIMGVSRTTATNLCNKAIRKLRHYRRSVLYNLRIQEKANQRLNNK